MIWKWHQVKGREQDQGNRRADRHRPRPDALEPRVAEAEAELRQAGAQVLAAPTDVSRQEALEALAQQTLSAYGAVHLLCNNAGVAVGTSVWETTLSDWQWVLGVNLWGVIHGVRAFNPIMLEQNTDCHILNTASIQGLLAGHPLTSSYHVSKHAVVALSEQLHYELRQQESKIGVSVLCPGWVKTQIGTSGRNRPSAARSESAVTRHSPAFEVALEHCQQALQNGIAPEIVAECALQGIRDGQFYILPQPEWLPGVRRRMEGILDGSGPAYFSL